MRASACQCSGVSSATALSLIQLLACTYQTSPYHLELIRWVIQSGRTASCQPTSGRSPTPLLTNFPPPHRGSSPSFVSGGRGRLASGQAELLDAFLHVPGVWLPQVGTISELPLSFWMNLPLFWLQLGPIIASDFVRKLCSVVWFSENLLQ